MTGAALTQAPRALTRPRVRALAVPPSVLLSFVVVAIVLAFSLAPGLFAHQDPAKGDPDNGIAPGTSFEKLPEDWVCPECGAGKDQFEKENKQV